MNEHMRGEMQDHNKKEAEVNAAQGRIRTAIREDMMQTVSESLRSRASTKAWQGASDSARFERLANALTPEIESAIWCLRECISLGLIDAREFTLRPAFNGNPARPGILRDADEAPKTTGPR